MFRVVSVVEQCGSATLVLDGIAVVVVCGGSDSEWLCRVVAVYGGW